MVDEVSPSLIGVQRKNGRCKHRYFKYSWRAREDGESMYHFHSFSPANRSREMLLQIPFIVDLLVHPWKKTRVRFEPVLLLAESVRGIPPAQVSNTRKPESPAFSCWFLRRLPSRSLKGAFIAAGRCFIFQRFPMRVIRLDRAESSGAGRFWNACVVHSSTGGGGGLVSLYYLLRISYCKRLFSYPNGNKTSLYLDSNFSVARGVVQALKTPFYHTFYLWSY